MLCQVSSQLTVFNPIRLALTMGFFLNCQSWGGHDAPHYRFVAITSMIMKFSPAIKLDVFYTIVTKKFVTSLLLRNYDVISCILAVA